MGCKMSDSEDIQEFSEIAGSQAHTQSRRNEALSSECGSSSKPPVTASVVGQGTVSCWEDHGGQIFFPSGKTIEVLPTGQYQIQEHPNRGLFLDKMTTNLDELLVLPDTNCDKVLKGIEDFWNREEYFRKHGFLWKRGIMLWGPPGSGKTSLLQLLSRDIIKRGGITVYVTRPHFATSMFPLIRKIEPVRPIVVILEDIDAMVRVHGESDLLSLLDGEVQIDNVVYIATTNYPELLDKRLINRPSRFDEVVKIGMPSDRARGIYLIAKNPRLKGNTEELQKWVNSTKNFSVAHLRELIVAVECLGRDLDDTIKRLRKMNDIKISSEDRDAPIGFTA